MISNKKSNIFLTQTNFPRLWTLFQYLAGGTVDKRRLCKIHYTNQSNILEIGCSTGNIAQAFSKYKNINYTGIDIDNSAIRFAKNSFKNKNNFQFLNIDLRDYIKINNKKYDYVLFAGIIHHINDNTAIELLNSAIDLISNNGILVIVDPLLPDKKDPLLIHYYMKLEQGNFVKTKKEMLILIKKINKLNLVSVNTHYVTASPINFPVCAKFIVLKCKK